MAPSSRDAPPPTGPPAPRAVPERGPLPIPAKDQDGHKIPTNRVMIEKWDKGVKEPSEPPPSHMELDWDQNGTAAQHAPQPTITEEEALTPDVVQYLDEHGIHEARECAVRELMSTTPRPADPVLLLGRLLSAEARRRQPEQPPEPPPVQPPADDAGAADAKQGAADAISSAAQPVELG